MKDLKYIRKRKQKYGSSYVVDIKYTDDSGETKHFSQTLRSVDYGSEKNALIMAQKVRNDVLNQIRTGALRKSFPTVRNLYLRKWDILPLSIKTRQKQDALYASQIALHGDKRINDVTVEDIQTSLNTWAETHSKDSVQRLLSVWRQIYQCAKILGYEIPDRTEAVIMPKSKVVPKKREVRLDLADFKMILDGLLTYGDGDTYNHRGIWFMLLIMFYTGMRPAEALALTRSDIHDTFITINKSVGSTRSETRQIVPTKTESSVRNIPIVPDLRPVLNRLLSWSKHDYLLADEEGKLRSIDEVSMRINLVARKHHVKFNSYMLRHLMSSDLLHKGDSVVARDLLGHTSFSMTLDYARSTDTQIYDAIKNRNVGFLSDFENHEEPRRTIRRTYQIMRLCTVLRILPVIKGISEDGQK